MPHRCTRCGTIFEDGDSVVLSGCPNCGWNKFLYVKKIRRFGKPGKACSGRTKAGSGILSG